MDDAAEQRIEEPLGRAAAGDAHAFESIVREHQAMVYGIARHYLGDPAAAEELAQEVFLHLYRNLAAIESPAHLKFWLRRVAAHCSIDQLRRREPPSVSLDDAPEPAAAPEDGRDPWLSEKLGRLVRALPGQARMVLLLRFQEEMELHEIAEVMEMPVNTVKSTLRRSLDVLQEKLARLAGGVRV